MGLVWGGDRSTSARVDADVQSPEEVVGLEAVPGAAGRIKMVELRYQHLCHCRVPERRGVETEGGILCRTRSRQVVKMILGK